MAQSILSFYLIGLLFSAGERRVFWTKHASFKNHLYKKKKEMRKAYTPHTHREHTYGRNWVWENQLPTGCVFFSSMSRVCVSARAHSSMCVRAWVYVWPVCMCVCERARATGRWIFFIPVHTSVIPLPPPSRTQLVMGLNASDYPPSEVNEFIGCGYSMNRSTDIFRSTG